MHRKSTAGVSPSCLRGYQSPIAVMGTVKRKETLPFTSEGIHAFLCALNDSISTLSYHLASI